MCCVACVLLLACLPAGAEGKLDSLPAIFQMKVQVEERLEGKKEQFVGKEYLQTQNGQVNEALRQAVDALDAAMLPLVKLDPRKNAKANSRLDIETTYSRTGYSWMSALIIGRVSYKRVQTAVDFKALSFDLESGRQLSLGDLFAPDSPAWQLLAERVGSHLSAIFPKEGRDQAAIAALCTKEALAQASFTLGGGELSLHYLLKPLGLSQPGLAHVRFFYPELYEMMTVEGRRQTENKHWKKVALTFDDGPRYFKTVHTLNALRQSGLRATFFICGNMLKEGAQVLRTQFDSNHLIGSHSFNHPVSNKLSASSARGQIKRSDDLTLKLTGEAATIFRPPGGLYKIWKKNKVGLPLIMWSVDTYDYKGKSAANILRPIWQYTQDGDIILMHDVSPNTHQAIKLIAQYLEDNGYLALTVEELAWMEGVRLEPNVIYARFFEGQYNERKDSNLN